MSSLEYSTPFNKLLIEEKKMTFLNNKTDKNVKNITTKEKFSTVNEKNSNNKINTYQISPEGFYGSYYEIYRKLIDKDQNFFESFKHGYFGAFINEQISDLNPAEKCGIPFLFKNSKNEDNFKNSINFYLDNFNDEIRIKNNKNSINNSEKNTINDSSSKISDNSNKNKKISHLINESLTKKNFQNIKSLPEIILGEIKSDYIPASNILEETLFLNPFKVINFDVQLQKTLKNLVYEIGEPNELHAFYPDLIYLIEGIPSDLFKFNEKLLTFEIQNINFRFTSSIHKVSRNFLESFIDFGNKMFLIRLMIENYLYLSDSSPYIIKKFFSQINLIWIKLHENIMEIKKDLMSNKIKLIGLFTKIESSREIVNTVYFLLNLPDTVSAYLSEHRNHSIANFICFLQKFNNNLKSHSLINSLFNCFYSLNNTKSKNFILIKNILIGSLKSYLHFLIYLIFNNELIDKSHEYFIIKGVEDKFCIENSKVPFFLHNFRHVLLNNTILLGFIKQYDGNYFNVCNYKISEILSYIEQLNFEGEIITFINFKDKIFEKKLELILMVNQSIQIQIQVNQNLERIKRLNHIKTLKEFMSLTDQYNKQIKEKEILKKRKILEDLNNQILSKTFKINKEMQKLKNERLDEILLQNEREILKNQIKYKLIEKFKLITSLTNEIQNNFTSDVTKIWINKRRKNRDIRYDLFNKMFDIDHIEGIYQEVIIPENQNNINYHYLNTENTTNISEDNSFIVQTDPNKIKNSNVIKNEDVIYNPNTHANKECLPVIKIDYGNNYHKFFIKNFIFNDIITPIVETAIEVAVERDFKGNFNNLSEHRHQKILLRESTSIPYLQNEVGDILNKIQELISDSTKVLNSYKPAQPEVPLQIIIQEYFYDLIFKQYKVVNLSFVLMLKHKLSLFTHFELIKNIFLWHSGDLGLNFIDNIIDFKSKIIFYR